MKDARRSWVDAFDRVPVSYSARDEVTEQTSPALRLHADRLPVRRRAPLAVVRAALMRFVAGSRAGISMLR